MKSDYKEMTKEELEDMVQKLAEAYAADIEEDVRDMFTDGFVDWDKLEKESDAMCEHVWVQYQGLSESYEYCKICDIRKV